MFGPDGTIESEYEKDITNKDSKYLTQWTGKPASPIDTIL